jgi:adenine specific DNA methylase Mod
VNVLRTKIQLLWDFFIFLQKTLYFISQTTNNGIDILEETLFEIESNFEDHKLLLAGDFNSRTAELEDFMVGDKGNYVPGLQYIINDDRDSKSDIAQCKRNNKDKISNNFGRSLVQLCGTNDMCIINGRKTGDNDGEFT